MEIGFWFTCSFLSLCIPPVTRLNFLPCRLFVEVRTADPFDRFADIQIIFKHEDHHQMFRRDYREGRAGDPGLWQRHNDYWVEKRRREGWW